MNKQSFSTLGIVSVFAASYAFPFPAKAQALGSAACPPQAAQITVDTDYVTISLRDFVNASAHVAAGKEHDALLKAALLKDGAEDEQGSEVTTTNGGTGRVEMTTQIQKQTLTSFIQVKPQINKNGLIKVEMTNHLETVDPVTQAGAVLPSVHITDDTQTKTFMDGQTLMVDDMSDDGLTSAKTPPLFVIFAKVKLAAKPPIASAAVQPVNHI